MLLAEWVNGGEVTVVAEVRQNYDLMMLHVQ